MYLINTDRPTSFSYHMAQPHLFGDVSSQSLPSPLRLQPECNKVKDSEVDFVHGPLTESLSTLPFTAYDLDAHVLPSAYFKISDSGENTRKDHVSLTSVYHNRYLPVSVISSVQRKPPIETEHIENTFLPLSVPSADSFCSDGRCNTEVPSGRIVGIVRQWSTSSGISTDPISSCLLRLWCTDLTQTVQQEVPHRHTDSSDHLTGVTVGEDKSCSVINSKIRHVCAAPADNCFQFDVSLLGYDVSRFVLHT
eukprot:GHVQ01010187.1.p1 GENE.GHVQ01010187.1~~GHVQ01010187.1.p1  ORF type:complete len:251 (+),score=38.63 GHVQ01010187.1:218-970(+)